MLWHREVFILYIFDDYAWNGSDYIKLLDWFEETGHNYPIRIHSRFNKGFTSNLNLFQS